MIRKVQGVYNLECDKCGEVATEDFDTFMDVVEYKKDRSNDWKGVLVYGEWEDRCPECLALGE